MKHSIDLSLLSKLTYAAYEARVHYRNAKHSH